MLDCVRHEPHLIDGSPRRHSGNIDTQLIAIPPLDYSELRIPHRFLEQSIERESCKLLFNQMKEPRRREIQHRLSKRSHHLPPIVRTLLCILGDIGHIDLVLTGGLRPDPVVIVVRDLLGSRIKICERRENILKKVLSKRDDRPTQVPDP